MINGNKGKNALQLPKISPLSQAYLMFLDQYNSNAKLKTLKPKRSDTQLKQNSAPKDLRNNTIYLQFPIGKKRPLIQNPSQLQIDKLTQDAMFANRAICSMYRKDVRTRMYKYNEQRANLMTQRCANNYVDPQQTGLRELVQKQLRRKNEQRHSLDKKITKYPQIRRYQCQNTQTLSRWQNQNQQIQQQSNDSILQQVVQKSINKNNAKFPRIQ